jgi:hypothetical protein
VGGVAIKRFTIRNRVPVNLVLYSVVIKGTGVFGVRKQDEV